MVPFRFAIYALLLSLFFFFFNDTATTEIYTLSLHDALPIFFRRRRIDVETGAPFKAGHLRQFGHDFQVPVVVIIRGLRKRRRVDDEVIRRRSEEHTSELQSRLHLVCRLLLEKKKNKHTDDIS